MSTLYDEIQQVAALYPQRRSAILPALRLAQEAHGGWLPPEAFRYLTSHGALDEDHMRFLEQLLNRLDDPVDRQAVTVMANDIFDLFADVFAGIAMEQPHELA